jgi:mono/diheme cytochrome c family protein
MKPDDKRLVLITVAATLAASAALAAAAGTLLLFSGWYNIGATVQHWQPVYTLLEHVMHYSVRHHAAGIRPPELGAPQTLQRGAALYREHCAQCHGGPGVAQAGIGKSMQPVPGPLVDAARRWKPAEMYWITRHGIKMSGMPAWEFRLEDEDIWAVVAFLGKLPALSPQDYARAVEEGK